MQPQYLRRNWNCAPDRHTCHYCTGEVYSIEYVRLYKMFEVQYGVICVHKICDNSNVQIMGIEPAAHGRICKQRT